MATSIAIESDRHVPEAYEGTLEPNFYCRGWNSKRNKYCKQRAGHNTDHPGVGRCAWHGKGGKLTHGKYAKHIGPSLAEHLEAVQEDDRDITDLTDEVQLFRAITAMYVEKFDEIVDALLVWNRVEHQEAVSEERRARPVVIPEHTLIASLLKDAAGLADKIHAQQHRDSITKRDFFRLQDAMADIVANNIRGVEHILGSDMVGRLISKISDEWTEIRL